MRIGQFQLKNRVLLAPMAGITDQPFRRLCARYHVGMSYSEMMSANRDVWHTEKSRLRVAHHEEIGINAVQIAGSDPLEMAQAAALNVEYGAQLIDINMGCPAKKVNRKMAGSALMQHPELVAKILCEVTAAVDVPVTLKIRTGWDKTHRNCIEIAKIAEQSGIQALTIHGRTRSCLYQGEAEYDNICQVKQQISIPVIANGDITSAEKARYVLDYTGADAVMIGRGALGQPWLFRQIEAFLQSGALIAEPSLAEKCQVVLEHIHNLHAFYGEQKGYRVARKHVSWYLDNIKPDSAFKRTFNTIADPKQQLYVLEEFLDSIQ
ncbi:tRNA dihydrouridine synthase DusB [Testudinibacter sp. TR-2022]|uniref:tRNA dihydrouridine synthase DusB n=1 Tax=Testudinibacter sp. TR-2022 TaxID=2585029 RepID=UPI001119E0BC|nr:tRNA dihydrouridine synthase DusB [Testudinibacter sp. TR-2022]TNH04750.1 tRNA dihydrouridine synthase DusB [Pasteurellaceae bacterium Phil31]TNH08646.1 tRNA dihydrouridine synthase DusB [Testudinibacter sp. TR-2022]TNH12942.1 tRNA dihydrouridine synthase DusB [Testudinibacter sp. TR-2022]TNH13415.1 tRNA dihydrouridine synthase DusB [Testudinibacter sp. TR-2022]TNH16974.1 tRNA dihydrouridine synthase DusB [Testudinibacter sp. TR-2022]